MTRQSGLGRGLSALIPGSEPQEKEISEEEERFAWLPLSEVVANPLQPRTRFDDKKQQQLVESVRTHGILQPILVRSTSFGYEVVAGERRLRAAQEAGLFQIPALVRQVDDQASFEQAVVENLQRDDLNAIEEAQAFSRLMEEFGFTQQEVADRVGKGRPTVANALRLLHLRPAQQEMVRQGQISAGHGRALLGIDDQQAQNTLAQRIIDEELSVRQTEKLVNDLNDHEIVRPPSEKPQVLKDVGVLEVERVLSDRLSTKVAVSTKGGRGRIMVTFADKDDLSRLFNLINGENSF
ncbi:MAG TPA: ParB/RepB/Spo0J family partition protein [Acidimicrobiia bacterium]|jgi:ParB family chromosome partitioning protein|nr:ParB/RepB/Spo0J family partition protein [Acidimicrobiia bacterium]HIL45780.1 ParB/RepB/Spo0J family partition protein [Acidimicrobiia bacterium]